MLGLLFDAAVMFGVISMVSGEAPEFLTALLISFGFAVALAVCFASLAIWIALVALLPLVILFGVILSALFGMPLSRAVLGSAVFLAYKLFMVFVWAVLLS